MKIVLVILGFALVIFAGLFLYGSRNAHVPSSGLTVTNHHSQPIARVVLKDPKGVVCAVTQIPPGESRHCSGEFRGDGAVTYELETASLKRSGLIGFAKPGSLEMFDVELKPDGRVGWGATVIGYKAGNTAAQPAKK